MKKLLSKHADSRNSNSLHQNCIRFSMVVNCFWDQPPFGKSPADSEAKKGDNAAFLAGN
jgi:hypothetical protein